jgi:hypothetical protein
MTYIAAFICIIGVAYSNLWIILLSLVLYELANHGRGIIAWWLTGRKD